jgi:hypothetical protein
VGSGVGAVPGFMPRRPRNRGRLRIAPAPR